MLGFGEYAYRMLQMAAAVYAETVEKLLTFYGAHSRKPKSAIHIMFM
jgi:hypothetical protein